jgi:diguanylate cyclase (GGDEF)-like protein
MAEVEQEILRAARSGRPFALLMFDLDGLKAANDRFGHASGDMLLRAVADTLRGDIRITDVAGRYGGDEFVVLLPETDLGGAMLVADKLRIDVSRLALPYDGQVIRTSASIGVVSYPDDGRASSELMRRVDLAMYEAKRRGRDQIVRFAREAKVAMATGLPGPPPGPAASAQRQAGVQSVQAGVQPRQAIPAVPEATDSASSTTPGGILPEAPGRAPWESTGS